MGTRKIVKERKKIIESLEYKAFFVAKKANKISRSLVKYKNILKKIEIMKDDAFENKLLLAFKVLNFNISSTTIDNNDYYVLVRGFEKYLVYFDSNTQDLQEGYFTNAMSFSFASSALHCNGKCVVTKYYKKELSLEYINDCYSCNIQIFDCDWCKNIYMRIIEDLQDDYDHCKESIQEISKDIMRIYNEPIKRDCDHGRYVLSDVITDEYLKRVKDGLKSDIMEDVFDLNHIK